MRSLSEIFDKCPDDVSIVNPIHLQFSMKGFGFGEVRFYQDAETGTIYCDNECMSKDTIKQILSMMVDQSTLNHPR